MFRQNSQCEVSVTSFIVEQSMGSGKFNRKEEQLVRLESKSVLGTMTCLEASPASMLTPPCRYDGIRAKARSQEAREQQNAESRDMRNLEKSVLFQG